MRHALSSIGLCGYLSVALVAGLLLVPLEYFSERSGNTAFFDYRHISGDVAVRAEYLFQKWAQANQSSMEPIPAAPHLEDCWLDRDDRDDRDGELPYWWGPDPQPPWVRGCDEDNLPLTRRAQADIWRNQNPSTCRDLDHKFAIARWASHGAFGIGAQFHVMTGVLALTMAFNRTLVVLPGSFERAAHDGCKGHHYASLDCYFAAMTSSTCVEAAMEDPEARRNRKPRRRTLEEMAEVLASDARVVRFGRLMYKNEVRVSGRWGTPWLEGPITVDVMGLMKKEGPNKAWRQVAWWRAQAVRYMMRRPTPYLCHLSNQARHLAFGRQVATDIAAAEVGMRRAQEPPGIRGAEVALKVEAEGRWVGREVYMPGPIVKIHVRQGDKGTEMRLVSMGTHMWMAERVRLHVPHLTNVWLSTEMESVVEEAKEYTGWRFFYTENERQKGNTSMAQYESDAGAESMVGASFVNLIISAQCDYFIGSLGSNWNRLINEMRQTNGRLYAGYFSVNWGEW